jgi:hypothetical protein
MAGYILLEPQRSQVSQTLAYKGHFIQALEEIAAEIQFDNPGTGPVNARSHRSQAQARLVPSIIAIGQSLGLDIVLVGYRMAIDYNDPQLIQFSQLPVNLVKADLLGFLAADLNRPNLRGRIRARHIL